MTMEPKRNKNNSSVYLGFLKRRRETNQLQFDF
jgi:hypothetical protein